MATGAGQTPGPFLVSRHFLFRGAARCWPSAGLLVGGQLACRQVTPGKLGCGLPLRGHRGPGPVRASVHLSRVLTEQGSHLPYTSVGLLRWQPVRCLPSASLVRRSWTQWVMVVHQQRAPKSGPADALEAP